MAKKRFTIMSRWTKDSAPLIIETDDVTEALAELLCSLEANFQSVKLVARKPASQSGH
jgi:hypothetical protein